MSLAFYMDENVHGAITTGLKLRDVDVLTVQEDGRSGLGDPEVMQRAIDLGRLLFSQDSDLLVEGVRCQSEGCAFPGIDVLFRALFMQGSRLFQLAFVFGIWS